MALPVVKDIRDFLEGYNIDGKILSDKWIENRMNGFVLPAIERMTKQSFNAIDTVTEYYNGNGTNILILNRRPIVSVVSVTYVLGSNVQGFIDLSRIEKILEEGILKSKANYDETYMLPIFAKGKRNIKIVYTYGYASPPDEIKEAIIYLVCEQALGFVGARTGGGSVGVQGFNRSYGDRGKFTDIRNDLARQAHFILSRFMSRVVGG